MNCQICVELYTNFDDIQIWTMDALEVRLSVSCLFKPPTTGGTVETTGSF